MPNTTVQAPDGNSISFPDSMSPQDITAAMQKLYPPGNKPGVVARASEAVLGTQRPVDELKKTAQMYEAHPLKQAGTDLVAGSKQLAQGVVNTVEHPFETASKLTAAPTLEEDIKNKNYRGAVGDVIGGGINAAMLLAGGKPTAEGIARTIDSAPLKAAREVVGISDNDLKSLAAKHDAEQAKALKDYQDDVAAAKEKHAGNVQKIEETNAKAKAAYETKVTGIKQKYSDQVAAYQQASKEASAKETAAQVKRDTLVKKSGPVYQKLTGMADDAQQMVQDTNEKIKQSFNGRYSAWRQKIPQDAVIDGELTQQAVKTAEDKILKGSKENIAVFRNIMKEGNILSDASVFRNAGKLPGADIKDVMQSSHLNPVEQARVLKNLQAQGFMAPEAAPGAMPQPGAEIPLDDAMGYSSELGEKLYRKAELPADVWHALKYVRDQIDNQVMGVAKASKADVEFRQLKSDYAKYKNAFYDHDSPLYKLRKAQDPGDKLRPIVGDEGQRAVQLIGQFKDHGGDPAALGKVRSLYSKVKDLPGAPGKTPTVPSKPSIPGSPAMKTTPEFKEPEAPTTKPFSAEESRRAKIQSASQSYAHPPSRWEIMFPPLMVYRLIMKRLLQSPEVQDWLAKNGPAVPSK